MIMSTLLAFVFALALLIAVHEWGHYRVAVACGVRVLRFSLGFGRVLWSRRNAAGTEFAVSWLPLGGYVRMLDEREAPVVSEQRRWAFNTQSLVKRSAIVAAGPLANLVLAVLLYTLAHLWGMEQAAPVLGVPLPHSLAERAGLQLQDRVQSVWQDGQEPQRLASFEALRWQITQATLVGSDLQLHVQGPDARPRELVLPLSQLDAQDLGPGLWERVGLGGPYTAPLLGAVLEGGPAQQAGLREGDRIVAIDGQPMADAARARAAIRAWSGAAPQSWDIVRAGHALRLAVTPRWVEQAGQRQPRVEAFVGAVPEMVQVRYGPWDSLSRAAEQTAQTASLTLRMMGRMLLGQASVKNLSGPVTIAEFAGRSAHLGLSAYLAFLALVSVSLGVLNLLPLPMLDGGHLLYYLFEAVSGRPVSDLWLDRLQKGGMVVLGLLMSVALFNDLSRLLG